MTGMNIIIILLLIIIVVILFNNTRENFTFNKSTPDVDVYVINLERRPDRLAEFKESYLKSELASHNLNVVRAVDGSIPEEISGFETEGSRRIVSTGRRDFEGDLTPGMLGCYLSHYKVYDEFLKTGKEYAFVFEDDAKINNQIYDKFVDAPEDWDIIMICIQVCNDCPEVAEKYTRPNNFFGTAGYVINRKGVEKMIQNRENPIVNQFDGFIGKLTREEKLNVYSMKDNLLEVSGSGSDVQMRFSFQ
jgi:GR25 family glycosyltransferase involved in LPS biosynthesis